MEYKKKVTGEKEKKSETNNGSEILYVFPRDCTGINPSIVAFELLLSYPFKDDPLFSLFSSCGDLNFPNLTFHFRQALNLQPDPSWAAIFFRKSNKKAMQTAAYICRFHQS